MPTQHPWKQQGDEIVEFVTDNDIDTLALNETWLKPEHVVAIPLLPAGI